MTFYTSLDGKLAEWVLQPGDDSNTPPASTDAAVREWLERVMRTTGLKPTPLAKAAGLAPSTVLRALDPNSPGSLERRSIDKIVQALSVPPPQIYGEERAASGVHGFGEPEVSPLEKPADSADFPLSATEAEWTVNSRCVDLIGYLPGDRIVADSAAAALPRDVVIAQVVDQLHGTAETVLRVYDPPYLLTETTDPASRRKPLLVDHDRVAIWGVVVKSWRTRRI